MEDMFKGDETSIYWYSHGVNWRAFAAFLVSLDAWYDLSGANFSSQPPFALLLPGWIMSLQGKEANAWIRMFNLTWILGITISSESTSCDRVLC